VHFKSEYGDLVSALPFADGLAVLGIFLELSETDNPALQPLIDAIPTIAEDFDEKPLAPHPLESLLPTNTHRFYRYSGGLTTPTCNEIVTWTVFDQPIPISEAQLEVFRSVKDDYGKSACDNFRPTQPLNGRTVSSNKVLGF